jgi:PAS domain S-box-containing protein
MIKSLEILDNFNIKENPLITVLNEVGAYVYMKDLNGKYTYANNLVLKLFNTSLDDLFGKDDSYFFNLALANEILENDKKVFNGEILEVEEKNVIKETNETKYYIAVKKPLYDSNGRIYGMFGISTDITHLKKLENRLRKQKFLLDTVLNNVDAYIYMKDENRIFRYVNSKVANLFRKPIEEIIGKYDRDVIPVEIADVFWESDKEVLRTNDKIIIEEVFNDKEKGNIYYWSTKLPYLLEDKTPAIIGFSTDITILKSQEVQLKNKDKILYQQSKVAAMGEMIENIAHQWRQPLSIISTISSQIKLKKELNLYEKDTEDLEIIKDLEKIVKTTGFLSDTIDYFRNFLRNDCSKEFFTLNSLITDVLELTSVELKINNISIIKEIEDINIFALKNEIIQVLINIINNAKDAYKNSDIQYKNIYIKAFSQNNDVIIELQDNAGGIDDKIIDRIFEPYFTTKHKSSGTGIGLFISEKIVTKHLKGEIKVENRNIKYDDIEYKGACFKINFKKNSD